MILCHPRLLIPCHSCLLPVNHNTSCQFPTFGSTVFVMCLGLLSSRHFLGQCDFHAAVRNLVLTLFILFPALSHYSSELFYCPWAHLVALGCPLGKKDFWILKGKSKLLDERSNIVQGETFADLRHGQGRHVCSNGDTHEGGWYKGMRHGHGTATFARGFHYTGEFQYDHAQGYGSNTPRNSLVCRGHNLYMHKL